MAPGDESQAGARRRKDPLQTAQTDCRPVFGIIKSAMGFTRFHLRGIHNVAAEWTLAALAYNCRRINRMLAA